MTFRSHETTSCDDGPSGLSTRSSPASAAIATNPERNAYFGDLHVHTEYSFDAYTFGTLATPRDAYRYAQGEAIPHPAGYQIQLDRPLDFYSVTTTASSACCHGGRRSAPLRRNS